MSARDEILARLRAAQQPAPPTPVRQSSRQFDDLAARFTQALTAAKGEVHWASDWAAALQTLDALLTEVGAKRGVVNAEPPLDSLDWRGRWPGVAWHVVGQAEGELRAWNESAEIGISAAQAALAETGTLIVSSGPGRSRLATLTPAAHVVLLPIHRLTRDLFTWTAARSGEWPANVTLISGPSKSADIEQTLIVGMHGPQRPIDFLYAA